MAGDEMVRGIMHGGSTQRPEALNHVRATLNRKDQHYAASSTVKQRHDLGDARWNKGRFASTNDVLREAGIANGVGSVGGPVLQSLDNESVSVNAQTIACDSAHVSCPHARALCNGSDAVAVTLS
eukprot:4089685-Prymnesium_polylepis.1